MYVFMEKCGKLSLTHLIWSTVTSWFKRTFALLCRFACRQITNFDFFFLSVLYYSSFERRLLINLSCGKTFNSAALIDKHDILVNLST